MHGVPEKCGEPSSHQTENESNIKSLSFKQNSGEANCLCPGTYPLTPSSATVVLKPLTTPLYLSGFTCILHLITSKGVTRQWVIPQERAPPMEQYMKYSGVPNSQLYFGASFPFVVDGFFAGAPFLSSPAHSALINGFRNGFSIDALYNFSHILSYPLLQNTCLRENEK